MNMKSKRILLTLGLIVMCLAVISTVSAGHQYTDAECKEIASSYASSLFGTNWITQVSSSSSEVVFDIAVPQGHSSFSDLHYKVSVNRDTGVVHMIGGGSGNIDISNP